MSSPRLRGKIEIEDVTYTYPRATKPALSDINFTFEAGAFYCILGKNGSGKSTLLRCMNALVFPAKGRVSVCEFDTRDEKTVAQARKNVSMVFQNPQTQLIAPTVEEEVAFGPENLGLEAREIEERVEEALRLTGIKHLSGRPTERLSLGEKQLVAIAGVLAMRPAFLLSDESTSMLDSSSRARILDLFAKLKESKIGVIHVTHFVEEATRADGVLILGEGRLVKSGNPRETLGNPVEIVKFGIEPLPVTLIAHELQLLGYPLPDTPLQPDDLLLWTAHPARPPLDDTTSEHSAIHSSSASLRRQTSDMQHNSMLALRNVTYSYPLQTPRERLTLDGISLELSAGKVLCVAGNNGSGKSTLAQLCAGLIFPSSGSLELGGKQISRKSDFLELRRKVGILFQSPEDQLFADSVFKDVSFGPKNLGLKGSSLEKRVQGACEMVGLPLNLYGEKSPFSLSEGEKRRAALAGILAMEPQILILDEPFIGLDFEGRKLLESALEAFIQQGSTSIILFTHELAHCWELATDFAFLSEGKITAFEKKDISLLRDMDFYSLSMNLPQWAVLARKLSSRGARIDHPENPHDLAMALISIKENSSGK